MAGPSAEDIINAFAEAVRESLEDETPIEVPGLGRFDIEHRQSQMIETDAGEARMAPPRDEIKFRPDSS
jgi:nucleoid DNA-binding protein